MPNNEIQTIRKSMNVDESEKLLVVPITIIFIFCSHAHSHHFLFHLARFLFCLVFKLSQIFNRLIALYLFWQIFH